MKLEEKICSRKIMYLIDKTPRRAFRLALLYFILAKRKSAPKKIVQACMKSIYWLKRAGVNVPEQLKTVNPYILFDGIEKVLVSASVGTRQLI